MEVDDWPDRTEYWNNCVMALRGYAQTGKSSRLKPEMARYLADRIEAAVRGYPPKEWKLGESCSYNDSYEPAPEVLAVQYMDYCRAGIIPDKAWVARVARKFGVHRDTASRWFEDFKDDAWSWRAP